MIRDICDDLWKQIISLLDHRTGRGLLCASKKFQVLCENHLCAHANDNEWIKRALKIGNIRIVEIIFKRNEINYASGNYFALKWACFIGNDELIQRLLKQGADPTVEDNIAIKIASRMGNIKVVKQLLLDSRVDPSADKNYAIKWATQNNHWSVVSELLNDKRVNPAVDNGNVYMRIVKNGDAELVKKIQSDERILNNPEFQEKSV